MKRSEAVNILKDYILKRDYVSLDKANVSNYMVFIEDMLNFRDNNNLKGMLKEKLNMDVEVEYD